MSLKSLKLRRKLIKQIKSFVLKNWVQSNPFSYLNLKIYIAFSINMTICTKVIITYLFWMCNVLPVSLKKVIKRVSKFRFHIINMKGHKILQLAFWFIFSMNLDSKKIVINFSFHQVTAKFIWVSNPFFLKFSVWSSFMLIPFLILQFWLLC